MVMETITQHHITQFSERVHEEAQQSKARLMPYAMMEKGSGEKCMYDSLGHLEARKLEGRFQAVTFDDIDHSRRKITPEWYVAVLGVDKKDVVKNLTDPKGRYAKQLMQSMQRALDRVYYNALFATVYTGKDGDTAVTAASDGVLTVDATSGLVYEKLLEIQQNFIDGDVTNENTVSDASSLVMGITGDEHTDLMSEVELTSGDYTRNFVVNQGKIQNAMGINLVHFAANQRIPVMTVSGGVRSCFVAAKNAIAIYMWDNIELEVQPRNDLHDTYQIVVRMGLGAVRTEGKLLQKVTTTD